MNLGISARRGVNWPIAGLCFWAAAAGAAFRGQSLAAITRLDDARPWLIGAALLGLPAVMLLARDSPASSRCSSARDSLWPWPRHARRAGWTLIALSVLASSGATALNVLKAPDALATVLWGDALLAALAGVLFLDRRRPRITWRVDPQRALELVVVAAVIFGAFVLRWHNLATIPPDVHGDEAAIGLQARRMIAGDFPVAFGNGWMDFPALSFASRAASMLAFGNDLLGLRAASVLEGVASVGVLYLLARRLWGSRVAIVAAGFMAIAAWHIHFSRSGLQNIQATLVTLVAFYWLIRALQDRRPVDWLVCGFAFGWSLETYYGARIAPVIGAMYVAYQAVTQRDFLRSHARELGILVFGAAVFLAPFGAVYARNPDIFGAHSSGVLVTSGPNLQHELDGYHVSTLAQVLAIQTQRTLEAFNLTGETSLQYGHPGPLLDSWTGGLLAMGAIGVLLPFSRQRVLLSLWICMSLIIGSILTIDALFSPREVVVIPALTLAAALMLEHAWRGTSVVFGRLGTYAFALPTIAVSGLALQANIHDYFDVQIVERVPAGRFTLLSNYVQATNDHYRAYVIGNPDFTLNYDTPRFLVPNADAVDVGNGPLALPLEHVPPNKGVTFIVESTAVDYAMRLTALRTAYPRGREERIYERLVNPVFTSYLVENSDLVAASPAAARD